MSTIAVLMGSVYGAAEELAEHFVDKLSAQGLKAQLFSDTELAEIERFSPKTWLVVTSTTGTGDLPDNIVDLYTELQDQSPNLTKANYAVVAMGDSSYVDSFCGAGKQFDSLLNALNAASLLPRLDIDACETTDPIAYSVEWFDALINKLT